MKNEHTLTHDQIAQRAELIWRQRGQPRDCDLEIWLEAERNLATEAQLETLADVPTPAESKIAQEPDSSEQRLTAETAAESMVEFHISPPVSDTEAVKAALQKDGRSSRRKGKGR